MLVGYCRAVEGESEGERGRTLDLRPSTSPHDNAPGYLVVNIISVDVTIVTQGKKGNEISLFPILRHNGPRQQITLVSSGVSEYIF